MMGRSERTITTHALKTRHGKALAIVLSFALAAALSPVSPYVAYADDAAVAQEDAACSVSADRSAADSGDGFADGRDAAASELGSSVFDASADAGGSSSASASADPSVGEITYIRSFSDLLTEVLASRTRNTAGVHYALDLSDAPDKTLDLTSDQVDQIVNQIGSLTFGSKDNPFRGTFDGRGYTIKGLNYDRQLFVPAPDTGLFAWTDGATIKNINFTDAYVGADYRGGVIVGCAKNTTLEHIKLTNCTSSVTPANNAVSLITNAGLAGGMVAGEMENCTLYDVEVQGGRVVNNSTAAVSGLGGEGLYLGAIAGVAKDSNIEYCRVTPVRETQADGSKSFVHTQVHNKYDIAVGAVAGQAVYAGGICGSLYGNSSNMLDCFSTADCYTYAATYVSVGAGNVGYVGGLVARADGGVHVVRSHYAGNLHSYLYNAVVLIPIIQKNMYLGGLVEWDYGGSCTITNSYFAPHFSAEPGTNKDIPAIFNKNNKKVYEGESFGAQDEATYADRAFWESHDFDFTGGIVRNTAYMDGAAHANKWVMDYELGIPVHGDAVKATFDFPGAGSAGIGESDVLGEGRPQSTNNPYEFAVQGFVPSDFDMDFSMTLNGVSPETTPAVSDTVHNAGYRFNGWYRQPNVTVDRIDESHAFFDSIVGGGAVPVSTEPAYTARNTGPGTAEGFAGEDLFVAYCQGQVLFHDIKGNVIDLRGAADADTSDDWYDHEALLPAAAEPQADRAQHGVGGDAVFLGWTWLVRDKATADGVFGYPSVTASQLGDIEKAGAFVKPGDAITQPMDLYPVYADYASNIVTRFEGNEQDALDDFTMREGVGRTDVVKRDNGYAICVAGAGEGGALPDGYRFLGWYELFEDGTSSRVSQEAEYVLPASVDLTREHTYEARFEYRVEYLTKSAVSNGGPRPEHESYSVSKTMWVPYKTAFEEVKFEELGLYKDTIFDHWSQDEKSLANGKNPCTADHALTSAHSVTAPVRAYAHVHRNGNITNYDIKLGSDFPDSASFEWWGNPGALLVDKFGFKATPNPGYRFWFWDGEGTDNNSAVKSDNPWNDHTDLSSRHNYEYTAHMTADVTFHGVLGAGGSLTDTTVHRQYMSTLFKAASNDPTADFTYGLSGSSIDPQDIKNALGSDADGFVGEPSPTYEEMDREGYVFLGWIDGTAGEETEKGGPVWQSIYDVEGDPYCTTNATHAFSYVLTQDAVCTRPADLYPVYAKYDYAATTNIKRAGVPAGSGINLPADPASRPDSQNQDFTQDVLFTADTKTAVTDGGDAYRLVSWTIERSDGVSRVVTETDVQGRPGAGMAVSNDNASLLYAVEPGYSYVFVANYEPLAVLYHTAEGSTETVIRNEGDALGKAPEGAPGFNIDAIDAALQGRAVFLGWTEQKPADGAEWLAWPSGGAEPVFVDEQTSVDHAMELFPVYRAASITVNSNIDHVISAAGENPADYRDSRHEGNDSIVLSARDYPNYEFVGWYRNYDVDGEKGLVSSLKEYRLKPGELFSGDAYTAVYRQVYEVRYHGIDGRVLFTAHVPDGTGRTFVTSMEKPDGTMAEVPEDSAAWSAVMEQIDAQKGMDYRELFNSWQWVQDGKDPVAWEQFCRQPIAGDMDLYPVTRQARSFFTTLDSGVSQETVNTNDLLWALDSNADTPVKAYFKKPFSHDNLTVNVQQVSYLAAPDGVKRELAPLSGRGVALHASPLSAQSIASKLTDTDGNARFELGASLTISKKTKDAAAAGKAYSFKLFEVSTGATRTVTVEMAASPTADGFYAGSVTMDMPVGRYRIMEDGSWAWRYDASLTVDGGESDPDAPGVVTFDAIGSVSASCENVLVRDDWLDGGDVVRNEFNPQGSATAYEGGR